MTTTTTTTEPHLCGTTTRSGRPCRNPTSQAACPVHDPARWCGADNGHGGTCRNLVHPGRLCDHHDPDAQAARLAQAECSREAELHHRRARREAAKARQVEADALLAALAGCAECTTATLRAVALLDTEPDEDDPTPMAVAWEHVVEHLRLGHGLGTR